MENALVRKEKFPVSAKKEKKGIYPHNKRLPSKERSIEKIKPKEPQSILEILLGIPKTKPETFYVVNSRVYATVNGKQVPAILEAIDRRWPLEERNRPYPDGGVMGAGTYKLWVKVGKQLYEVECSRHYGINLMSKVKRRGNQAFYEPVTSAVEAILVREQVIHKLYEVGPLPQHKTIHKHQPVFVNEPVEVVKRLARKARLELVRNPRRKKITIRREWPDKDIILKPKRRLR